MKNLILSILLFFSLVWFMPWFTQYLVEDGKILLDYWWGAPFIFTVVLALIGSAILIGLFGYRLDNK